MGGASGAMNVIRWVLLSSFEGAYHENDGAGVVFGNGNYFGSSNL
jgi:hypothetical protein